MARRFSQPGLFVSEEVRIGALSRIRSVAFLGLLLLGLLSAGFLQALPAPVRFLLAFSVVSWIPGSIVARRFLRCGGGGPLEKTVFWVMGGLATVSLLTWLAEVVGLSFSAYSVVVQWVLATLFGVAVVLDARGRPVPSAPPREGTVPVARLRRPLQRALVAIAAALALLALTQPPRFDYHQDSFDHIGYIRHIASENKLTPAGVLAAPVDSGGGTKDDPRKGTLHPIVALAARVSAVDPMDAWRAVPAVFFPLAFLSFLWFCTVFLPRQPLVWGCVFTFLLFQGGAGLLHGLEFANGQGVWLVYYWTLVPLSLRAVAGGGRRDLWAAMVLFMGGAFMHIGVVTHVSVLLATLLLFHRWLHLEFRALARLCAWAGVVAAVVLAWKLATSVGHANEIHLHRQGVLYVTQRWFIASPIEVLRQNGLVFFGGMVMLPFLLFAARRHPGVRLQLAFAVIPSVVCFFPPLVALLYDHVTYMLFRVILNIPAFAAVVTAIYLLVVWSRRRGVAVRIATAVVLLLWFELFFVPGVAAVGRSFEARSAERDREAPLERHRDVIEYLRNRPPGVVVVSDPATSYLLSAATEHRFVAVLEQHANPNDPYAFDRLAAVRDVLSPYVYLSEAVEACERFDVDVVVINGRLRDDSPGFLSAWSPSLYEAARARMRELETRFVPGYESEEVTVLFYNRGDVPHDDWIPEDSPLLVGPRNLPHCTVRAPGDAFYITEFGISPERALPGETVEVTVGYEVPEPVPAGLPYVIHIRFDHHSIALARDGSFFDKQVRRFRERRGGYLLRYRLDHRPFNGIYPVSQWPTAVLFYEKIPVKLPPALKPGTYAVELNIEKQSLLPNFVLRDFFYNRDHYSGAECLTIDIKKQLVR